MVVQTSGSCECSYLTFSALAFKTSLLIELNDKEESSVATRTLVDPAAAAARSGGGGAERERERGVRMASRRIFLPHFPTNVPSNT